jgi:hypothetical protein
MSQESITINVLNNTNSTIPISVMGNPANLADISNQFTQYQWNLSSFSLAGEDYVSIQYRPVGTTNYSTFNAQLLEPTVQGVANALNGLGIGSYFVVVSGGNTYIQNYDDSYEFNNLNVFVYGGVLFDFYDTTYYANGDTSVFDLSSNNNNGTPVTGTGNGTPTTLVGYNTVPFGYLFLNSSVSSQFSIRLPNTFKFPDRLPYTIAMWFTSTDTTFGTDVFQGLVSAEGRDNLTAQPIGYSFYIQKVAGVYSIFHSRFNQGTGARTDNGLTWGSSIAPPFAANTYYFVIAGYDGTTQYASIFANDGNRYDTSIPSSFSLKAESNWGAFLGLRFNNWLNGNVGFVQIYPSWIGYDNINNLYNNTKGRYGY